MVVQSWNLSPDLIGEEQDPFRPWVDRRFLVGLLRWRMDMGLISTTGGFCYIECDSLNCNKEKVEHIDVHGRAEGANGSAQIMRRYLKGDQKRGRDRGNEPRSDLRDIGRSM